MLFGRKYTSYEVISFYSVFLGKANNLFIETLQGGWNICIKITMGTINQQTLKEHVTVTVELQSFANLVDDAGERELAREVM